MDKCEVCGKEYRNVAVHMRMAHPDAVSGTESTIPSVGGATNDEALVGQPTAPLTAEGGQQKVVSSEVMEMLKGVVAGISSLNDRISKIEDAKSGNAFKKNANPDDVLSAKATRENVDPRIVNIVDELLGDDFGIEILPNKDNPGFQFTIIVPQRLSDLEASTRPVLLEDGTYKKDKDGVVVEEMYYPEDRRSRSIASHQSFDAIRAHAEKVRSYIVAYYQKMNKPIPEFKLKSNV